MDTVPLIGTTAAPSVQLTAAGKFLRWTPFITGAALLLLGLFGIWAWSCHSDRIYGDAVTYSCSRTFSHIAGSNNTNVTNTVPPCAVSPHHFNIQKILFSHNIIAGALLIVAGVLTNWFAGAFKSTRDTMIRSNGWHIISIDLPLAVAVSGWVFASALMLQNVCFEMLLTMFIASIAIFGGLLITIHMVRLYAHRVLDNDSKARIQYFTNWPLTLLTVILLALLSAALIIWVAISWHANSGTSRTLGQTLAAFTCVVVFWIFAIVALGAFDVLYSVRKNMMPDTVIYQYLVGVAPLSIFAVMYVFFLIFNKA